MLERESFTSNPAYMPPVLDWRPDTDRLRREVDLLVSQRRTDDLLLAEIECTIDLLDAELVALANRPSAQHAVAGLKVQRAELARLIWRLQGVSALRVQAKGGAN